MLRQFVFKLALFSTSLAVVIVLLTATAFAGEPSGDAWHRDWASAYKDSQCRSRPILMFFTMKHCYSCEKMSKDTYSDEDIQRELESQFVLASINLEEHPEFVKRLRIRSFPTTVIMSTDNKVLDCMQGYVGPEKLRTRLQAATAKVAQR